MKAKIIFVFWMVGGLATGFFLPYALLWCQTGMFNEGSPYFLALLGAGVGGMLFSLRGAFIYARHIALGMALSVFLPTLAFLGLGMDITEAPLSWAVPLIGLFAGFFAARRFQF